MTNREAELLKQHIFCGVCGDSANLTSLVTEVWSDPAPDGQAWIIQQLNRCVNQRRVNNYLAAASGGELFV